MLVLHGPAAPTADDDAPGPSGPLDELVVIRSRKFHYFRSVRLDGVTSARARDLLKAYGRLVISIVNEPCHWLPEDSIVDRDDLIHIGQVLMLQACESFEEDRGAKESTWVAKCVRQGLKDVVRDARNVSRTDVQKRKTGPVAVRPERLPPVRLDEPLQRGDITSVKRTMLDAVSFEQAPTDEPFHQAMLSIEREWLYRTIDERLSGRKRRYLLAMLDGDLMKEIGEADGVSRQMVERVVGRAVEILSEQYRKEQRAKRLGRVEG